MFPGRELVEIRPTESNSSGLGSRFSGPGIAAVKAIPGRIEEAGQAPEVNRSVKRLFSEHPRKEWQRRHPRRRKKARQKSVAKANKLNYI
jgi:hypothetical protein